jgi:MYXO-CTERM domain-containing protein
MALRWGMRKAAFFASSFALSLFAGTVSADVYEPNNVQDAPNGLLVPIDSSPEVQLYTLFTQRGENLDWHTDAHTMPNAFSPLCGFTATYVLNQAGSHFGLAWYNETKTQPTAADLHQLVPPNSAVGTMFTGTAIMQDPNYTGGLVGFALVGGETHYTNLTYDNVCSNTSVCNPAAPWITALMYASTVTPNAYYICFEDGSTSASGWNNDGDFNDDVFFLTGITCQGGGQPCNTGKMGICAAGLTQCSATGTTCEQLNQPKTMEICNGLDDDCNGVVDDNAPCPTGEVCQMGTCVASCEGGEFTCPPNEVCSKGYCVAPACANVTCPAGQVCENGTCKGPCDGVTCPFPEVCRVGACVDPCAGVTCGAGQVCDQGVCIASCACLPCATGKACDATSGSCVDPTCVGKTCAAATHCVAGTCVDDCKGAVCPNGGTCMAGKCMAAASSSSGSTTSSSGLNFGSGGAGGAMGTGASGLSSSGGGATGTGAAATGGTGGTTARFGTKSACGCRTPGSDGDGSGALALAGIALALASTRRRRTD